MGLFRSVTNWVMVGLIGGSLVAKAHGSDVRSVELVRVDDQATGYATFQSHNQKVVSNRHGIFFTYIRTRNKAYTAQRWRLMRSTDGGKTFSVVYEATHATNPAALETDEAGTVYLCRPDFQDGNAYLYRFFAKDDFSKPMVTTITGGAAGKFSLLYDAERKQLYWFAHNNTFHVIGLDGVVRRSVRLLRQGKNAMLQYPLMTLGGGGSLHAGWTTQKHGVYLYWSIHHMVSEDAGRTWRNLGAGTAAKPLGLPVVTDDGGPTRRITLDDEFDSHTWLSNMLAKDGKVHFLYMAQTDPPREHYVRMDEKTGKQDVRIQPEFRGKTISLRGLSGFFATQAGSAGSTLYCLGRSEGRIGCLASDDNGETWHDYAVSEKLTNVYSLGGCRELTDEGWVIGTFTDQLGSTSDETGGSHVYFFRIRTWGNGGHE